VDGIGKFLDTLSPHLIARMFSGLTTASKMDMFCSRAKYNRVHVHTSIELELGRAAPARARRRLAKDGDGGYLLAIATNGHGECLLPMVMVGIHCLWWWWVCVAYRGSPDAIGSFEHAD